MIENLFWKEEKMICGKKGTWLDLSSFPVNHLPNNFYCEFSLSCDNSLLKELPQGLWVKENLYIGNCDVNKVPDDLVVGGDLILLNSAVVVVPKSVCVLGNIISLKPAERIAYQKNNKYENCVCDTNGDIVPFRYNHYFERVTTENDGEIIARGPVQFFSGPDPRQNAIYLLSGNIYYKCSGYKDGIKKVEMKLLKDTPIYNKYLNYDINEKMFVKDLKVIFKDITKACDIGIEEFFEKSSVVPENKYSIKELCDILQTEDICKSFFYKFLFIDYFLNRPRFDMV